MKWALVNGLVVAENAVRRDAAIVISDGVIERIETAGQIGPRVQRVDIRGHVILPGFIDVHVHGGAGYDVNRGTVDALFGLAGHLARHGVTSFFPTTITAPQKDLLAVARAVAAAREKENPGARIVGLHLEGPFLCRQKCGAQPPEHIRPPSLGELDELLEASQGAIRLITIAPDIPGARAFTLGAQERGVQVAMGHSNATYAQGMEAMGWGIRHITHAFNAMRGFNHREPGLAGLALVDRRGMAEVIADGVHVHPTVVRLLIRARGVRHVTLVSDAILATGLPPGRYPFAGREIVTSDAGARFPDGTLAGSLLTLDVAVRHVRAWCRLPWPALARLAATNAASEFGLPGGRIAPGHAADLVVCTPAVDVIATFVQGRIVVDRGLRSA
jgi:N-acetylglucosamine-6-phosphate deacetylase